MTQEPKNKGEVTDLEEEENRPEKSSSPAKKKTKKPDPQKKPTKRQLTKALKDAEAQVMKYKTQLAYVQADHENYVKSMERREANLQLQANRDLILSLLPVLDDLERAQFMVPQIEANKPFIDGLSMLVGNLKTALENAGVTVIECEGKPFDPLRHEAVVREESKTEPPNTVLEELRKGYLLKGMLLRPSMVKISVAQTPHPKAKPESKGNKQPEQNESEKNNM